MLPIAEPIHPGNRCDYGLCAGAATMIVQTQADPTNHVLGEERPMCANHAIRTSSGAIVARIENTASAGALGRCTVCDISVYQDRAGALTHYGARNPHAPELPQ